MHYFGAWLGRQPLWVQVIWWTFIGGCLIVGGVRGHIWWAAGFGVLTLTFPFWPLVWRRLRGMGETDATR